MSAGEGLELGRAALLIELFAAPERDIESGVRRLDELADALRPRALEPPAAIAALFGPDGFRGNAQSYYDPRNSFLGQVLERRLGIPISLAVVAIEVGRRLGIPVEGVPFPGHFLVRVPGGPTGPVLLDVFDGARRLDDADLLRLLADTTGRVHALGPEQLAAASPRQILTRMLYNLKAIYLRADDIRPALAVQERLVALDPERPIERRDRGLLRARLGLAAAAARDLVAYLAAAPDAEDGETIATILGELDRSPSRPLH